MSSLMLIPFKGYGIELNKNKVGFRFLNPTYGDGRSHYDRPWQASEARQTRLVFIGRALDRETIEQALC